MDAGLQIERVSVPFSANPKGNDLRYRAQGIWLNSFNLGPGKAVRWLRMLSILAEHRPLILSIHVVRDSTPSSGLCGHLPRNAYVHIYTNKINLRKIFLDWIDRVLRWLWTATHGHIHIYMYVETHTSSCTLALSDLKLLVDQSLTLNLACSKIRGNRNKPQRKKQMGDANSPNSPQGDQ